MREGNTKIQAILFDFMGVLLFLRDDYPGEETVDAVDEMIGGVVNDAAFRGVVLEKLEIDEKEFQRILGRIPEKYESYPPLWNLLPALRKQYKIGIINNGTRLTFPNFDARLKLSEKFDLILSSGAEWVRKPDTRIYRSASDRLGVDPRRCLFMDDSEANIRGARECGMQIIHWKTREEGFRRFIERLRLEGMTI